MKSIYQVSFCLLLLIELIAISDACAQKLPHSVARPDQVAIKHLHLDLKVDFDSKKLMGAAELLLTRQPGANEVHLDTDGLDISGVTANNKPLKWKLGERDKQLGRSLSIELPESVEKIRIDYASRPTAEAVQWLSPEQMTDKKHRFLFTQSQAI